MSKKLLLGLCGLRCSGKSELRKLIETSYDLFVFDTNSIPTGDNDANAILPDEIVQRYGKGESYFHFLQEPLQNAVDRESGLIVIDSIKSSNDVRVLRSFFPFVDVYTLWIHAPYVLRYERYKNRDLNSGIRTGSLKAHDDALIQVGISDVCLNADFVISNVFDLKSLENDFSRIANTLIQKTLVSS